MDTAVTPLVYPPHGLADRETLGGPGSVTKLISDHDREVFEIVNYVTISSVIGVFGIFSNIINIIIFTKHKFNESVNVSLLSLSVSDLLSLIFLQWFNVCVNPLLIDSDIPFYPPEFQYITAGWPHVCFTRITLLITVFVAIERCLSIKMPLKVKTILTPKRSLTVIITIYVVMLLTLFPAYISIHIDWTFIPQKNRTLLGLVVSEDRAEIESITVALNVAMQLLFFCFIVGSNAILIYELQMKTKWRQSAVAGASVAINSISSTKPKSRETESTLDVPRKTNPSRRSRFLTVKGERSGAKSKARVNVPKGQDLPSAAAQAAIRDRKLARMIVFLSAILFVCYLPSTICLLTQLIEPEFSIKKNYENIFFVGWSFAWVADAINSSVNIFIYYNMSSKYRATFKSVFSRWHRKWRRVVPETAITGYNNPTSSFVNHSFNAEEGTSFRPETQNPGKPGGSFQSDIEKRKDSASSSASVVFQLEQKSAEC